MGHGVAHSLDRRALNDGARAGGERDATDATHAKGLENGNDAFQPS
jgi:hypothetical protein